MRTTVEYFLKISTYMLINFFRVPWDLVPSEARHQIEWRGQSTTYFSVSTCFTRGIILLYFNLFFTIQLCYILSNQCNYDDLNAVSSIHSGLVIICAFGQVTYIRQVMFERLHNYSSIHERSKQNTRCLSYLI